MQKQRYINLRQLFRYLLEMWWVIGLAAICFACVLGGLGYRSAVNNSRGNDHKSNVALLKAASDQNRSAYYNGGTYTDNALADGMCNAYAKIYIEFNFDNIPSEGYLDFGNVMNRLQADARILLVDDVSIHYVIDSLKLNEDEEMNQLDVETIRWLVNKNTPGKNIMQIAVSDVNEERAVKICEKLIESFTEQVKLNANIDSVSVIDKPYVSQSKISASAGSISKGKIIKFAVLGAAVGIVMGCVLLVVLYIIFDCVRNAEDIQFAGSELLDTVRMKKGSAEEDIKRIAYYLLMKNVTQVSLVPVDRKTESYIADLTTKINGYLNEQNVENTLSVEGCKALRGSADTLLQVNQTKCVLFVAGYGKSCVNDVKYNVDAFSEGDIVKLGTVIIL